MGEGEAPWWRNEFYSQFGEDSVLFGYFRSREYGKTRRLDTIGTGFFVDVGAHHPFIISNTWFFYKRGWRGINIEPTPGAINEFKKHRPDDINLEFAVSGSNGTSELISYGRDVKNTLEVSDVNITRPHEILTVETRTLESVFDEFIPENIEIDLLSIDVEGHDLTVLNSNNWEKYRPEIVVVEDHHSRISEILNGKIYKTMAEYNYSLYAWVRPSLIFRRNEKSKK